MGIDICEGFHSNTGNYILFSTFNRGEVNPINVGAHLRMCNKLDRFKISHRQLEGRIGLDFTEAFIIPLTGDNIRFLQKNIDELENERYYELIKHKYNIYKVYECLYVPNAAHSRCFYSFFRSMRGSEVEILNLDYYMRADKEDKFVFWHSDLLTLKEMNQELIRAKDKLLSEHNKQAEYREVIH